MQTITKNEDKGPALTPRTFAKQVTQQIEKGLAIQTPPRDRNRNDSRDNRTRSPNYWENSNSNYRNYSSERQRLIFIIGKTHRAIGMIETIPLTKEDQIMIETTLPTRGTQITIETILHPGGTIIIITMIDDHGMIAMIETGDTIRHMTDEVNPHNEETITLIHSENQAHTTL